MWVFWLVFFVLMGSGDYAYVLLPYELVWWTTNGECVSTKDEITKG